MRAYIEGVRCVDFTDDAGKRVKGLRAFYQYKDPDCIGLSGDSLFVRFGTDSYTFLSGLVTELLQGENDTSSGLAIPVTLDFNSRGRLLAVTFLDDSGVPWSDPVPVAKGGVNDDESDNDD